MIIIASSGSVEVTHPTWGQGFLALNLDTLFNTALVCAILAGMAVATRMVLRSYKPRKLQGLLEMIVEFIQDILGSALQGRTIEMVPLALSLFIFIMLANWIGLVPMLKSPTNDLNTTIGLAMLSFILIHMYSIKIRSFKGYVSHYFSVVTPSWLNPLGALARVMFAFIEIVADIFRPITLALRLYLNIFVGELLLSLIIFLFPKYLSWLPGMFWVLFSLFIGALQAFVFLILTVSYISAATEIAHDH